MKKMKLKKLGVQPGEEWDQGSQLTVYLTGNWGNGNPG